MTLTRCPDCGRQVSDRAVACPNCGRPIAPGGASRTALAGRKGAGFEYRSERTLFGWPLVHVVYGASDNATLRPARGILAFGNIAIGLVAFGGIAVGGIALGGITLGPVALGGVAIGLMLGAGGIATGYWALGGVALGAMAIGGVALGAMIGPAAQRETGPPLPSTVPPGGP
ncbi:zinc ribbon domain-containing protein [Methylorubrum aminovorans]|nr:MULTISPECIES: zinc ribbon domain-containing protein [unclassified Methylobacterium]QIJ76031.1 zinc-ribbon domain-containing protein [Methylobacterium sp. CLZ]QIJ80933.1 zinc-ribbon domain-containing protein [Methylobacterium sp. NI91]